MTRGGVAGAVRRNKEAHPEKYCANKQCLWSLKSGPCPKHFRTERLQQMADAVEIMYPREPNV